MNTLLMLFIFVPILSVLLLGLNLLFAFNKPNEAKESVYECGFNSVYGQTRSTFQIHFFLVALLFLVFDLEVLLIYPLAVTLYQVSVFGFSVALIFFIVLTIGFVLEIGSGAISIKKINNPLPISYKNNRLMPLCTPLLKRIGKECTGLSKTIKSTFSTASWSPTGPSAIISKENLNDINSYWETIHEKDMGQETNNPHIIARRHITKGGFTDAKIINMVQSQLGHSINQEELDKLNSIKPVSILFDNLGVQTKTYKQVISCSVYNAKVRSILNKYIGRTTTSIAGVYIWTNLKTGEQNVGSSINLYTRLRSYFKPSILNKGNRLINQSMKTFGIENFKLDIYIIDTAGMVYSKIRAVTLCLEQYYIFILNPSLNKIKVAGSNPIVEFTKEHIASIKKANSKPVYVYKDKTLIYEAPSAIKLIKETNISNSTVSNSLKDPSIKVFEVLTISHISPTATGDPDIVINKVDANTLKELINNYCPVGKRTSLKVNLTLIDHTSNNIHTFSSGSEAHSFLKTKGLNVSSKTILKYRDTGKIYKNWSFYTNYKPTVA
jgi:NADH-ubiquinone oxidoreductase chain 3